MITKAMFDQRPVTQELSSEQIQKIWQHKNNEEWDGDGDKAEWEAQERVARAKNVMAAQQKGPNKINVFKTCTFLLTKLPKDPINVRSTGCCHEAALEYTFPH